MKENKIGSGPQDIMREQNLALIRQSISNALLQESQTGDLERYLNALTPKLHKAICLPQDNPTQSLLQFIVRYIENVPDFLEALETLLVQANIEQEGRVFLSIAEEFFLNPPEMVTREQGLKALIDEAYLAHRLIEEINDRLLMMCGCPLSPMDMTLSNIIVHDILGEEFANQLDLAVHYAIEALFDPASLHRHQSVADYLKTNKGAYWGDTLNRWPCLAGDSAISLEFQSGVSSKAEMH